MLAGRHTLPGELMEELEALDELELLGRDPGARQSGDVVELRPGLEGLRQLKATRHRVDDQLAPGIGLEVVDGCQKIGSERAQALGALERRLNAGVTLLGEPDDEREV